MSLLSMNQCGNHTSTRYFNFGYYTFVKEQTLHTTKHKVVTMLGLRKSLYLTFRIRYVFQITNRNAKAKPNNQHKNGQHFQKLNVH